MPAEKASSIIRMVIHMKETGSQISATGTENMKTKIKRSMKVCGRMIFNLDKELKFGQKAPNMKESTTKVKSKVTAFTHGPMAHFTQATGTTTKLMAWANTSGRMAESTMDHGKTMTCTVLEFIFTLTV